MRRIGALGCLILSLISMSVLHSIRDGLWAAAARQTDQQAKSESEKVGEIIQNSDCQSCHAVDRKVVGPAFSDIADKYAGQANAVEELSQSIRHGGSGKWGDIRMTPHPSLKDADLTRIVNWILSLKGTRSEGASKEREYTYSLKDGKTTKLDFPLFEEGSNEKVTKDVFRGFELYNSYCFRCHGEDVTDSELAPDLKRSLKAGLTPQDFISTMMAGREEKGMPSWAGFLTENEARDILMYVQGRTLELIPVGRPPSDAE